MANISSNVIYVEPNYYNGHRDSYESYNANGEREDVEGISIYEMAPPLEDYCIAFQLAVEVPAPVHKGATTTNNTVYILTYNNTKDATAVSLLQGTKMPGSDVSYLTTAALETTLEDVKKQSPTEMFGVKSIDITYNAWMTPEVTMKFTDIRGASMFVPEELRHPGNGLAVDSPDIAGSFFKCFFVTPYPLFGLVVKGFYGEAVSYELMYSKFNYKLDSSTGNYEAEAKFIGYTWSILADMTLNAVCAAPYSEYKGEKYWKENVENGRFTTEEGDPMPTIPQIVKAYNNLKKPGDSAGAGQIPAGDTTVTETQELETEKNTIDTTLSSLDDTLKQLESNLKSGNDKYVVINNSIGNGIIWIYNAKSKDNDNILRMTQSEDIKTRYTELQNIAKGINGFDIFPSTFTDWNKEPTEVFTKEEYCATRIQKTASGTALQWSTEDSKLKNISNETWSALKASIPEASWNLINPGGDIYVCVINISEWRETVANKAEEAKGKLEQKEDEMKAKLQIEVAEAIGMAPTLYNMMKVIMAHVETLNHCVLECATDIPDTRTFDSVSIDTEKFYDECSSKPKDEQKEEIKKTELPPFPSVKSKKEKDGRTVVEDDWLGDLSSSDELVEVTLIESLLKAIDKIYNEVNTTPESTVTNEDGTQWHLNCVCPVVPSDVFIENHIFNTTGWDTENAAYIAGCIALRASYVLSAMRDSCDNTETVGKVDAINFHEDTKGKLGTIWKDFISNNDKDKFADIVIDLITKASPSSDTITWANGKGLPWQGKGAHALMNTACFPILPEVKATDGTLGYAYPLCNISFDLDGLGKTSTVTNNWETTALRGLYNSEERDKTYGKALFKMVGDPRPFAGISEQLFSNEKVSSTDNISNISDNFERLINYGKLNDDKNDSYGEKFGGDNWFSSDYRHDSFTKTFTSTNEGNINHLKPVTWGESNDGKELSYTFPNSVPDKDYKSAFRRKGEASDFKKNLTEVRIYDGSSIKKLKRDKDDNLHAFFQTSMTDQISNWTVVRSFGVDTNGKADEYCSVFAQEPYINAASDYEKAIMFLMSLVGCGKKSFGLDMDDCVSKFGKTSSNGEEMFKLLPYTFFLLLGGYYFWVGTCDNAAYFRLGMSKTNSKHYKSRVTQVFKQGSLGDFKTVANRVRGELKYFLKNEFICWVTGTGKSKIDYLQSDLSFKTIQGELEVFSKETATETEKTLRGKLASYLDKAQNIPNNDTLEYWLALNVVNPQAFFRNYFSIRKAEKGYEDYSCILYYREDSEFIRKLTWMYVQPVLFTAYNEWLQLDGKIYCNCSESKMKSYLTAFHEKYSELIGVSENIDANSNTLSDIAGAADIDKHVKITLYNYIKILYDRWLSAKLFQENVTEHWNLENFFKPHFHFIDQFYVDCKDIFFDMEGLATDFNASFTQETYSLLSFIQNALAKTRCVMYPVQNFLNYYDEDSAKKMMNIFKPIPYNEAFKSAPSPSQIYPDFVILYSSEPSNKVDLADECGDSYMLNYDEMFLPYPIRTNPGKEKSRIPAFGVTYGKQYQSYFQSIDVSTDTPIPTEQSLKAQYMIAGMSSPTGTENGQQIQCLGQDLYTIYSKQSYSCTVQMMGDMWIQPTMYFVLTNVPTFRGSYMIQKVNHQITPGRMTTTFMGTRMASTTQPHVYNWYVGKAGYGSDGSSIEEEAEAKANIDNDCPYKVFIPGAASGTGAWTDEMLNATVAQFVANPNWETQPAQTKAAGLYNGMSSMKMREFLAYVLYHEAGILPDIGAELTATVMFNNYTNGVYLQESGKSIRWFLTPNMIATTAQVAGSQSHRDFLASSKKQKMFDIVDNIFKNTPAVLIGKTCKEKALKCEGGNTHTHYSTGCAFTPIPEVKAMYDKTFTLTFPTLNKIATWWWPAEASNACRGKAGNMYSNKNDIDWANGVAVDNSYFFPMKSRKAKWELKPKKEEKDKTLCDKLKDLVDSIQSTCMSSQAVNISQVFSSECKNYNGYSMVYISAIKSMDKPSKDNATLFDIALNAYGDYHHKTYWVVADANSGNALPIKVALYIYKSEIQPQRALAYVGSGSMQAIKDNITECPKCVGSLNEYFYRSLAKKYLDTSGANTNNQESTTRSTNDTNIDNNAVLSPNFFKEVSNFAEYQSKKTEVIGILTKNRPEPCFGGSASWSGAVIGNLPQNSKFWWVKEGNRTPPK